MTTCRPASVLLLIHESVNHVPYLWVVRAVLDSVRLKQINISFYFKHLQILSEKLNEIQNHTFNLLSFISWCSIISSFRIKNWKVRHVMSDFVYVIQICRMVMMVSTPVEGFIRTVFTNPLQSILLKHPVDPIVYNVHRTSRCTVPLDQYCDTWGKRTCTAPDKSLYRCTFLYMNTFNAKYCFNFSMQLSCTTYTYFV